jgi:hypothetical protein
LKACSLIFPVGKEGTKTLYRLNTMYGFAGKEADLAYQDEAFSVPPMRKVRAKKVSAPPKTVEKPRIVIRMADYRKSAIQEDESFSTYTTSISGGG